ncbi:MAG: sigma-70 family RNA polymerase sigma factor [Gemmataceae bacterium]
MSATASAVLAARLAAARAGSSEALGLALDGCRRYLMEVARQSLPAELRPKGGASDLVQETYIEAQRQFSRFDGASAAQLRAWLRALLLHKAAKLGRRYRSTQKRQLTREQVLYDSDGLASAPTPSVQVMANEQLRLLHAAIERLPDDYREVMGLRYREGLSFEDVGRRLGRSADAARMLWARAVERLRQEMQS